MNNCKNIFLALIITISIVFYPAQNLLAKTQYSEFLPSKFSDKIVTIAWNSEEGRQRLMRSEYKNDFFQLAHNYQPQSDNVSCSLASSVTVLNALRLEKNIIPSQKSLEIDLPEVFGGKASPYPAYSQATFLNEKTDLIKDRKIILLDNITEQNTNDASEFDPGVTLKQLYDILTQAYNLEVELNYADEIGSDAIARFRHRLKKYLLDDKNFIIANFHGKSYGAKTSGHIAPLGAYDSKSDSVLVLDVTAHKNPWHWVNLKDFYLAMNVKDGPKSRGYLVISDKAKNGL